MSPSGYPAAGMGGRGGMPPSRAGETQKAPPRFSPDALRDFGTQVLKAAGLLPEHAWRVADSLVFAEMRGIASHGLARLAIYVRRLQAGLVNPRPRMRWIVEQQALALLDADNGPGAVGAAAAMEKAVELAGRYGVGACAVRNSNHCGAMAYYVQMAVDRRMVGMAMSNANPTMTPWGGREAVLGTNPISVGVPTPGEVPFVLDMATSAAARGKILLAAKQGRPIPEGWALDRSGRPTRDANAALAGLLLPMAGPKGYGLALWVDILCGALAGSAFGRQIGALYEEFHRPQRVGHFMLAMDVGRLVDRATFERCVGELLAQVKSTPPAEGFEEVLVPGEPEARAARRAQREGIELPEEVYEELVELAQELGVTAVQPLSQKPGSSRGAEVGDGT